MRKRTRNICLSLLAALIALPTLAFSALHLPVAERFVEQQLESQTQGQMKLQGLDIHGLLDVRFSSLTIGAREIEMKDVALTWSPWRLLAREASIQSLTIGSAFISPPATGPGQEALPASQNVTLPGLPELPLDVKVEALKIEKLTFAAPAFGLEGRYGLQGALRANRTLSHVEAALAMPRHDRAGGFTLSVAYGRPVGEIGINIHFEDEDGAPIAALTGYNGGALNIDVAAQGPLSGADITLNGSFAAGPKLTGQLNAGYGERLHLRGDLTATPAGLGGPQVADYAGAQIPLNLDVSLGPKGTVAAQVQTTLNAPKLSTGATFSAEGRLGQVLSWSVKLADFKAAAAPAALGPLHISAHGKLDQPANVLAVEDAKVKAATLQLTAKGAVPLNTPLGAHLQGTLNVTDLSALAQGLGGSAAADFTAKGDAEGGSITLNANAKATLATETMPRLEATANLAGTYGADGAMAFTTTLQLPQLVQLDPALKGSANLKGNVQGSVGALAANIKAQTEHLVLEGAPLTGLAAQINLTQAGQALTGNLDLTASTRADPLRLRAPFAFAENIFTLNGFALEGPGLTGQGALSYNTAATSGSGEVAITVVDLAKPAKLFGQQAVGQGQLALTLEGDVLNFKAQLQKLQAQQFGVTVAALAATFTTNASTPQQSLSGTLTAQNLVANGADVPLLNLTLVPADNATGFDLTTSIAAPILADLKLDGAFSLRDGTHLALNHLAGEVEGEKITLAQPTRFTMGQAGTLTLAPTMLKVGEGALSAQFTQNPQTVTGALTLRDFSLANQLPQGFPLFVNGQVGINGAASNPQITVGLQGSAEIEALDEPLHLTLDGSLTDGALKADMALGGAGGNLTASANGRALVDFATGQFALDDQAPLTAQAKGRLGLAPLAFLLFDDGSTLGGGLSITAEAVVQNNTPRLNADLCLDQVSMGLVVSGTQVAGGQGCITLDRAGGLNGTLSATDGKDGRIALELSAAPGTLLFADGAATSPLVGGTLKLVHMRVLDGDIGLAKLTGNMAGQVTLGENPAGNVDGKITVEQADILIPSGGGTSFTTLDVTHVGRPGDGIADIPAQRPAAPFGSEIALDVKIAVPQQFFVRGRGIESEWRGDLAIAGTVAAPAISGDIAMVKGQATTGAAVLEFTKGKVSFVPDPPAFLPIMLLDMVSEAQVDGTLARMSLFGPVLAPKVSFSSEPTLPEDEILARLLFGKPAAQMTTGEAVSLAGAALELTGSFGGGLGLVGQARRALGVDRLSVDSSSVSAGKYITPELYLSVTQSADGAAPDIAVEYELTDQITITGEQEGDDGEAVGVRYEFDY